jgi:hypothetical protein
MPTLLRRRFIGYFRIEDALAVQQHLAGGGHLGGA